MYVHTVGDVAECNRSFIFLKMEDSEELNRIHTTAARLRLILKQAREDAAFYERMYREVKNLYDLRSKEVDQKWQYITDEQIAEVRAKDEMDGWMLGLSKDSHNVDCVRERSKLSGIFEAASYAMEREREAVRIGKQAEGALHETYRDRREKE